MLNANIHTLRVISLRAEDSNNEAFEVALRNAGHKVTVLSSTEPAFALVNSSWPDVVLFDPISRFGMSGSIHRLRSGFDGVIIAAGFIPDPTISAMLEEMGISKFADSAGALLRIVRNVPNRTASAHLGESADVTTETESVDRQLELSNTGADYLLREASDNPGQVPPSRSFNNNGRELAPEESDTATQVGPARKSRLKKWHRTAIGTAVAVAVIIAVAIPFFINQTPDDFNQPVAKALPIVPRLLTEPLAPLTVEELSGETLPLEIAGIKDQAIIEELAVAFWGDTAPDAFVTVNGEPVSVSEYGAFVVDYPLDDGANFIEILASDFQGRTTRKSFTVVSLQ
jgi:hypothetical protein